MNLSPHFTLAEAGRSQTATRCGINNHPPPGLHPALERVAKNILEPVRARYGIPFTPSSWYRCATLNERIGGSSRSQHVKGEAVDIEVPGVANRALARWIATALDFDQLILEFFDAGDPASGWVHVSTKASGNRREVLTIGRGGTLPGLPDS